MAISQNTRPPAAPIHGRLTAGAAVVDGLADPLTQRMGPEPPRSRLEHFHGLVELKKGLPKRG